MSVAVNRGAQPARLWDDHDAAERAAAVKEASDLRLYFRILGEARRYWGHIFVAFLLTLLSTPLALLTPLPLKIAVDSVVGDHPVPGFLEAILPAAATGSDKAVLAVAAGLMVAIVFLGQLQGLLSALIETYTGEKLVLSFRAGLFRHVQRLSLAHHDEKGTTDALYRIQYDTYAIQNLALNGVIPFVVAVFTFVAMLLVVLKIDAELTLVAISITPVFFLLTHVYRPRLRRQSKQLKQLESSSLSVIQETLGALRVVKAFGREDYEQERFVRRSNEGLRARLRFTLSQSAFGLLIALVTAVGTATVLYVGVSHVQAGALTLGSLLLVMSYLSQVYSPIKTVSKKLGSIQASLASAERAFALLDKEPDVPEKPHARHLRIARGDVSFREVSFLYRSDRPVLQRISFDATAGTRVGIAGATGAGKTTLVSLLGRFYDPVEGEILLDGVDLRDYKLADLRRQFAIVLQEPVLFSTSIAENIAYARPEATYEEIVAAARAASAHDFVTRLPDGYETQVGERGMRLSGGERQRLSLARAFLRDAPILILDEPTSSVDVSTEALIMDAMDRLMAGRTAFMIAHRLSTLENCDLRLELHDGRLVVGHPATRRTAEPLLTRTASLLPGRPRAI